MHERGGEGTHGLLGDVWAEAMRHPVPESECPFCGYEMDVATSLDDAVPPSAGDLSMCLKCLSVLRFRDDMRLEALPDNEFRQLPEDLRDYIHRMRRAGASIDRSSM